MKKIEDPNLEFSHNYVYGKLSTNAQHVVDVTDSIRLGLSHFPFSYHIYGGIEFSSPNIEDIDETLINFANSMDCERGYKTYEKISLGVSDSCEITLVGKTLLPDSEGRWVSSHHLHFGEDGDYRAYLTDENALIGDHYHLETSFRDWMVVLDDNGYIRQFKGAEIRIYRAGWFGCVIQVCEPTD